VLTTLSIIGALGVTAVVTGPRLLSAGDDKPVAVLPREPAHQETLEALQALIGRSRGVLAIHDRGQTPFVELVLWLEDIRNKGSLDLDEVFVITHSEILWTMTGYSRPGGDGGGDGHVASDPAPSTGANALETNPVLDRSITLDPTLFADRDFCVAWRTADGVQPRVLASGISGFRCEPEGPGLLRISLTWPSDSVDGPDRASVCVDVMTPSGGVKESHR
jgi:hypothetical protein